VTVQIAPMPIGDFRQNRFAQLQSSQRMIVESGRLPVIPYRDQFRGEEM
jgi:hypothetical protein